MMKARRVLAALTVSVVLCASVPVHTGPVLAAEEEDPAELARQGMERMLRAIELMIEMIPQYEMPEVLENGDIIIRRRNPERDGPDPSESSEDETRT